MHSASQLTAYRPVVMTKPRSYHQPPLHHLRRHQHAWRWCWCRGSCSDRHPPPARQPAPAHSSAQRTARHHREGPQHPPPQSPPILPPCPGLHEGSGGCVPSAPHTARCCHRRRRPSPPTSPHAHSPLPSLKLPSHQRVPSHHAKLTDAQSRPAPPAAPLLPSAKVKTARPMACGATGRSSAHHLLIGLTLGCRLTTDASPLLKPEAAHAAPDARDAHPTHLPRHRRLSAPCWCRPRRRRPHAPPCCAPTSRATTARAIAPDVTAPWYDSLVVAVQGLRAVCNHTRCIVAFGSS